MILNPEEFLKIFFYKFIEKYEEDIYFHANDDDYYFDGIVLTGKEYKN